MRKFNIIAVTLVLFLFSAVLLMGKGITGMASLPEDSYTKQLCSINNDCSSKEVCCLFSGSDAGVCNYAEACSGISELTDAQKQGFAVESVELNVIDTKKDDAAEFALGAVLFIATALLFSYYISRERNTIKNRN